MLAELLCSEISKRRGSVCGTHEMESLKASMLCPYLRFKGQAMVSYSLSIGISVFSATCRMMECTSLDLLYLSSHF